MWQTQSGDVFEVLEVIAGGSSARAGLKAGDQVVSINAKRVSKMFLPDLLNRWKYSAAGTKSFLRVYSASGSRGFRVAGTGLSLLGFQCSGPVKPGLTGTETKLNTR